MSSSARSSAVALALALLFGAGGGGAGGDDPSDLLFKKGEIPRLRLELSAEAVEHLHTAPREWVPCKIHENDKTVYDNVSVRLKGAAGSFREFDDKPALTVKMDKVDKEERFHGLEKFHLDNSVQDGSFLHELLGSDLFLAAGVLTPRVTHAHVWLNDRDVGFYVLKEGFDKPLLHRGFDKASGNLYDGGFCQDLDADLHKESGKGPDDHSDLRAIVAACKEVDATKRWQRISELVDVDAFTTFMAMEFMLGHWDGYSINRNNYRIYFEPKTGKAYFLPHGMDQVLGDPEASVLDHPSAMLAAAVTGNPAWRAAYRKRIGELIPLFDARKLARRVDEVSKRIETVLATIDKGAALAHKQAAQGVKQVLEAREKSLKEQKSQPEPKPLVFAPDQPVKLDHWRENSECEDAQLTEDKPGAGDRMYRIACGKSGRCVASWRKGVLLPKGKYKLQAAFQTKDVAALQESDAPGVGAGLRVSGESRDNKQLGNANFHTLEFRFEVAEEMRDVELVLELRASRGSLSIRAESVKLTRLGA
jgi:hypothetical protein